MADGLSSFLRFCFWIDDLKGMTLQSLQFRLRLDHLGLSQHLRLPKHTRWGPAHGPLLRD